MATMKMVALASLVLLVTLTVLSSATKAPCEAVRCADKCPPDQCTARNPTRAECCDELHKVGIATLTCRTQ
jgi:hypothetical protein